MSEIIQSCKDVIVSRLKSPFFGAFILAWATLNINGIAVFILSSNEKRLDIALTKNWQLCDDFFIPLAISITYLVVIPIFNLIYDKFVNNFIDPTRYNSLKNRNSLEVTSSKEYVKEYEMHRLSLLISEKQNLIGTMNELRATTQYFRDTASLADHEQVLNLESLVGKLSISLEKIK